MLHCVLKQAATQDSKFWSNKLLHETLYLCGVILLDEDSTHPKSLCNAAIGAVGSEFTRFERNSRLNFVDDTGHPFLPHLEVILSNQRAEEHHSLLLWCLQFLRAEKTKRSDSHDMEVNLSEESVDGSVEMTDIEREAQERRDKGLEKRAKLMSQIQVMQKTFLVEHKEELDKINSDDLDIE